MKKTAMLCVTVALVCGLCTVAHAWVRLPAVIGSNMVIQRDEPLTIRGWASPGENVTVSVRGESQSVGADSDGNWSVTFPPLPVGGPYGVDIRGAENSITLRNILSGDVWVCSGQSNMEMRVQHVDNADREMARAYLPDIRLFQIKNEVAEEPRDDCIGAWEVCRPSTVALFSAAGYFFGRELNGELDVPIGLINASWGGTSAETWMSMEAVETCPAYRTIARRFQPLFDEDRPGVVDFYRLMGEWEDDIHHQEYVDIPFVAKYAEPPETPVRLATYPQIPGWCFNGMIAPLTGTPIRGVIWYQGESNAGRAYQYRTLFPGLIRNWRTEWGRVDLPFIFVQLAAFGPQAEEPGGSAWAELREAQLMTRSVPNTAMAVAIDIGDEERIHPLNKQEVGRRLALGALHVAYGRDSVHSGPIYGGMSVDGNKVHLRFTHDDGGLVTPPGESLRGFAVAGEDSVFVWANAMIRDDKIIVWHDDVAHPFAVRYGWADNPGCNLYNGAGLPASPFRTDTRPGITAGRE